MSEIEKMYENAGIDYEERYNNCTLNKEGQCELKCSCDICKYSEEKYIYPPFTAEKQIELIKWLMKHDEIHGEYNDGYGFSTLDYSGKYKKDFEESLASVINNELWQDLTSEEKQQVKGILE